MVDVLRQWIKTMPESEQFSRGQPPWLSRKLRWTAVPRILLMVPYHTSNLAITFQLRKERCMLWSMGRLFMAGVLTLAVMATVGNAQCLVACLAKPCSNHAPQRPASGPESSCPHGEAPAQKDNGAPHCHALEFSSDSWLQPSKLSYSIATSTWAAIPTAAIQLPATAGSTPVNWVFLSPRPLQLPAPLILRI